MAMLVTATIAFVLWVTLWALGSKALDSAILALTLVVLVATARTVTRYLPGRDRA